MKTLGKIIVGVLICLVLALLVLRVTGLDPKERRPGLWLTGNLVTTPVTHWSFTDKYRMYDRTLPYVTDPVEKAAVLQLKAKKYPQQKI